MPVMICKADVSQADFNTLNWPCQVRDEIPQGLIWSHIWNTGVGTMIINPCSLGKQRGKNAPLKRTNVLLSCSKDTIGALNGEFILINTLNDISVLCFCFMQSTNANHWFNSDKNEILNEQSRYLLVDPLMVSPSPGDRVSAFRGLAKGPDCQKLFRL